MKCSYDFHRTGTPGLHRKPVSPGSRANPVDVAKPRNETEASLTSPSPNTTSIWGIHGRISGKEVRGGNNPKSSSSCKMNHKTFPIPCIPLSTIFTPFSRGPLGCALSPLLTRSGLHHGHHLLPDTRPLRLDIRTLPLDQGKTTSFQRFVLVWLNPPLPSDWTWWPRPFQSHAFPL